LQGLAQCGIRQQEGGRVLAGGIAFTELNPDFIRHKTGHRGLEALSAQASTIPHADSVGSHRLRQAPQAEPHGANGAFGGNGGFPRG
jgi:hypothetical protein